MAPVLGEELEPDVVSPEVLLVTEEAEGSRAETTVVVNTSPLLFVDVSANVIVPFVDLPLEVEVVPVGAVVSAEVRAFDSPLVVGDESLEVFELGWGLF
jgi:hypothetical protein